MTTVAALCVLRYTTSMLLSCWSKESSYEQLREKVDKQKRISLRLHRRRSRSEQHSTQCQTIAAGVDLV
jgi:hypothetical protein